MNSDEMRRQSARSSYSWEFIDGVIVIFDHDIGPSVTNTIEDVLRDLIIYDHVDIWNYKVIYRDTEGLFDGVQFSVKDDQVTLIRFIPIQSRSMERAIKTIQLIK